MSIEVSQQRYTVQEFLNLEWPDDDDNEYELIKGEIVAKPKSGISKDHGKILSRLNTKLDNFAGPAAGENQLGEFFMSVSTDLGQPESGSYVEPDLCFVLNKRIPENAKGSIPVAPDLVVEVWSPTDTTEKIQNKIDTYLSAGVRLIWSIYMVNRFIVVYTLNDPDPKFLNLKNELDGGEVLPGFKLPVSYLFD